MRDHAHMSPAVPVPLAVLPRLTRAPVLRALAAGAGAVSVLSGLTALVLHLRYAQLWPADLDPYWRTGVVWAVALGGPGGLLAWRRPTNPVGWLVLGAGLLLGLSELLFGWTVLALAGPAPDLWFHPGITWVATWCWVPGYVVLPTLVLLLVPDGRLPSPRWRWVLLLDGLALVAAVLGFALTPWDQVEPPLAAFGLSNPVTAPWAGVVLEASLVLFAAGALLSVASILTRWRGASGTVRQQLKWLAFGATLTLATAAAAFATHPPLDAWIAAAAGLPLLGGTMIAVLRHRLWDVETLIARSAVAAVLAVAVFGAYLALVGLVGTRLGRGGAPAIALVLAAVGLEPARSLVQRQVNRLVYGQRDDPYAVLAALGQRLEGAAAAGPGAEALPGVARTLSETLRLPYVGITVDGEPVSSHGQRPAVVEELELVHGGTAVGMLEIGLRRGERRVSREDQRLLEELARHLTGAVRGLQLQRHLLESRQQIVAAREEERRRLHRDLHDELGPVLAAMVLQLGNAHDLVASDPGAARALLSRLGGHAQGAVDATRRIVADLRPPLLDGAGVVGAVEELASRFGSSSLIVRAELEEPGPLPAAVEVVAVRVTAEALANAARHSGARHCTVTMRRAAGLLTLEICDDGSGIPTAAPAGVGLRSMAERVEELGGSWAVEGREPAGTRVRVALPVPP
jgi:two-component system NarL family sensor kinase